ncbi:AAA family ATPase [Pseudenhygromyxa sp. WMMC2535]|uniref:trifunctional serine/threonine-protein kinase/ATP-binding protein/sensor histidine kinase n=1 Tax=Pseudenhygromyxa sp. WMMC2535 TaxID=2712867 RepID=UPI001551FDAE|nr:AAA family ATPase [Pseudenhygromyxa sp. WMMC2535]NVB36636.1 AAA family ATPase [Pseudenhygromyxa sp. WMMC2535]
MGVPLTGYRTVRLVRASGQARVYEAIREEDGLVVIAKIFELVDEDTQARAEHEFALIQSLDVEGVVKALSLRRVGDQLVLLLERVPGLDLAAYTQNRDLELPAFLAIATQIAEILARVHARHVIHRDIKPTNILIEPETGRVHLADFGISVLLESERRRLYDPEVITGSLPYISPEQTGRTSRAVDFRSDLYSLGVTLYELLTRRRPFVSSSPVELIHAHLARAPEPPRSLRSDLPRSLDALLLKLLEKAPEHRYQTATGLAADLRALRDRCAAGRLDEAFELAATDYPTTLQLPQQLYGRERERLALVDALDAVVRTRSCRLMLLSGPPGVGKTALLADFEGVVAGFGGYIARGRFEAHRDLPYSAFVVAFRGLVDQLLTESELRLSRWREALEQALGGIGQVICELVPKLELVIGEQPSLTELEPHEARNRLHLAVSRFLSAFCADDRPLVLELDNLQWADASSLTLLRALLEGRPPGALLMLGAFRDNALDPEHPLLALLSHLRERHHLRPHQLRPLAQEAVAAMLSDTLVRPPEEVRELAALVCRKTASNPLFVRQFLTSLAEGGILRPGRRGWAWDLDEVEGAALLDDVLELMTAKLDELAPDDRELLARAACVGARFDLDLLALVCGRPRAELAAPIYALVDAGLLAHAGAELVFAHDRIHEAAHRLLDEDQRRALHWTLGQALRADLDESDAKLFEVVDHLDAGRPPELDAEQRRALARLELRAGQRAIGAGAYAPALRYLERGVALVADLRGAVAARGEAAEHYDLVVDLHFARAQALTLSQRREDAQFAFDDLLDWPLATRHFGLVAARRVRLLTLSDQPEAAIDLALESLARCGVELRRQPSTPRMLAILIRAWLDFRNLSLEQLQAMPACNDEAANAAMELLSAAKTAAYVIDSKLFVTMLGAHASLIRRRGFHPSTPVAMGQLAMGVGSGLRRVQDAIALCDRGLALCDQTSAGPVRARVESAAYVFVWHLGRPFATPLAHIDDAYRRALEVGDFEYAGYMGALGLSMHFEVGTHLRVVGRLSRRLEQDLGRWGSHEMMIVAWMVRSLTLLLGGEEARRESMLGSDDEAALLDAVDPEHIASRGGSPVSVYAAIINHAMVSLLSGEVDQALASGLKIIDDVEQIMLGTWTVPRAALTTVVSAAISLESDQPQPPAVARAMRKGLRIIERWAKNCPENYAHYRDLGRGLALALRGRLHPAMHLLEQARNHAAKQGCRWVEGLAAERLAALAERLGLEAFAEGARASAWEAYEAWGAGTRLDYMRRAYPRQFGDLARAQRSDESGPSGLYERTPSRPQSSGSSSAALDFQSVVQAVGVINEDLSLDEVMLRVLEAALGNAGADRGTLVLERRSGFAIFARATVSGERELLPEPIQLSAADGLAPIALIHFVLRTRQALVIDDARVDPRFAGDTYVSRSGVLSLLALPVIKGKQVLGALVLENRLSSYCFTPERLEALRLIANQAASALDNARLYAALRRGEARWRTLVDGAPDIIILLNARGEIEFVNRDDLFSLTQTDGEPLLERLLSEDSARDWREAVTAVLEDGLPQELELEMVREGHAPRWFSTRLAPIEFEADGTTNQSGGRRRNAIAVATDVTQRRVAEFEKQTLESQLRQQQRLESLGTLASGVAHEINNPVQGIMNYAELIADNPSDREMIQEFAGEITIESKRVATIVRNLLAFSRQEREQAMEDTSADALIETTLSLLRAVLRKDQIALAVEVDPELPPLRCRAQQIQQIIMNLVANARDALNESYGHGYDERKRILIRATRPPGKAGKPAEGWVRIVVEDSGPGIPPDVLPHIFDPFFTTKGRDQGTGLGLAVSHGIVLDHGGELSVDTTVGEGTRFFLDLPRGPGA